MSIIDRFKAYADAFEETFDDDDWSRLEQYFAEDAVYEGEPEDAVGRDAVLAKMRDSVNSMDRMMDSRELILDGFTREGDTVVAPVRVTMTKAGAPDIKLRGIEYATFDGDRISRLRDEFDPDDTKKIGEWMAEHGAKLTEG